MISSKLAFRLVFLAPLVVAGCGDDGGGSAEDGGAGGEDGGASTSGATTSTSGSAQGGGGSTTSTSTTTSTAGQGGSGGSGGAGGGGPVCGDGVVSGDEECDVERLADATCESLGFWFGELGCSDDCTLVTAGCRGPEVCDDGGDNDLDGYADCSDPACTDDPACEGDGERRCSDFSDDDGDGLIDCADADCQALAVCAPGAVPIGGACEENLDCAATGGDPFCFSAGLSSNWNQGYCTEFCDVEAQDCGDDAFCFDNGVAAMCWQSCVDDGDCRPGYECVDTGEGLACFPGAGAEVCNDDLDDDGDGLVDCNDPGCAGNPACTGVELLCGNFTDDDGDGLVDCKDGTACGNSGLCDAGTRPVGAPCSSANECASSTGEPACLPEGAGFHDGACSSWCSTDADCSDGGTCLSGLCFAGCDGIFSCRPGYICYPDIDACYPATFELCDDGHDDDGNDLIDCDDPACAGTAACTTPETECADLQDDDGDGHVDCADPSCADSPSCDPGDGVIGSSCVVNTACASLVGDDPVCITEDAMGYPDGLCTEWCDVTADECGDDAGCFMLTSDPLEAVCLPTCDSDDDCRDGYSCEPLEDRFACLPALDL